MKTKLILTLGLFAALGISIYGFVVGDIITAKSYIQSSPSTGNPTEVLGPQLDASVSALSESFEGATFPPAGWTKLSPLSNPGWTRTTVGTSPFPGFGTGSVVTGCPGGGTALALVSYVSTQNNEWLITPQITNVQPGDSLTFWLRFWPTIYPDSFKVKVSTTTPTIAAMTAGTFMSRRFSGDADSGWVQYKYVMGSTVPAGSNIYIGFQESFVDGSAFCLDLVKYIPGAVPPPAPTTWYEQTSGLTTQLTSVSAPDIQNVWVSGYAGKVIRTTNGGTWASASGNLGTADIYTIYAFDANNALVTTSPGGGGSGSFVYRTSNGGTNWNQVYTDPSASAFIDSWYFKDANNGLMFADGYGGRSKIYKTTNAGNTWDTTGVNFASTDGSYNNASFGIGDVVYFGTATSKFYKTTNFGASWAPVTATGNTNTFSFWFNDVNNGLIGGTIMQSTTNGGTTLTTSTVAGSGSFSGTVGTTAGNYWTARGTTVYGTTNQGTAWTVAHVGNGGTFNHMTVARTGSPHLYAVTSTGGISKFGGPFTGITPVTSVADKYSLSQNYPNPFNPTTNIKFAMPVSGVVSLKIYNMLGKEVATLVNGNLSSGSYSYDFNASNLASGVYFYKLETAEFSDVKKMMLVK